MTEKHYNLAKLICVVVKDFKRIERIEYKERVSFLGITLQSEGWYSYWNKIKEPIEDYLNDIEYSAERFVIKEKEIIEKPHVNLLFHNDVRACKYFESLDEANKYAEEIKRLTKSEWVNSEKP